MKNRLRGSFNLAMLAGASVLALTAAGPARSEDQTQTRTFDIPAQPLSSALMAYSRQADTPVVGPMELLNGKRAPAVQGAMSPERALQLVLVGSGLRASPGAGGGLVIERVDSGPQASSAGDGAETNVVQELVVTAQKKSENIQVVPIAISAFTQADLTTRQIAGGPDLMTQVPNMTFTKTNFSSYSIQIRGIGTQAISATTDPAVAVAFNNTPFVRNHFFEQEFYDLERVEVLRGPQGTLYGRNATAGVVNVISAKPTFAYAAKASGDIANYGSSRLEGMINIPLVDDKAALRLAGAWTKRDGYVKNILSGKQTDGRDLWSGRASLRFEPTDRFRADLIYEHFEEDDDRLRSGKQLCHRDAGPSEINGIPVPQTGEALATGANLFSQGCLPASLYSPDSFETPNGFSLPYAGAIHALAAPVNSSIDPYASHNQSRDLREIETTVKPQYQASADTVELQLKFDLNDHLSLTTETGYSRDHLFSFEDFNRFNTSPGFFLEDPRLIDANGFFCDPQLGCSNRLTGGDLSTAVSRQFSQEVRLSYNGDGPLSFNIGGNFLRYKTEDKYYVFINSLTLTAAGYNGFDFGSVPVPVWTPGVTDNHECIEQALYNGYTYDVNGYSWSNTTRAYPIAGGSGCSYIDPNDIHNLNDEGRNYFLSKNPYRLASYAAFGELYYNFSDTLKLTAGFRWTVDQKTAPQIPTWLISASSYGQTTRKVIRQEWREPTGRLAIDWRPHLSFTDETLLYASYVRGYKAGGANPPPPVFLAAGVGDLSNPADLIAASLLHPQTFDAEFVNAYEIGTKNTLLDGRLTLNLNGFYYDYTGYQISEIIDRSAINFNFDAKIWGAELEADWRPLKNLRLGLRGGYENTSLAKGSKGIDLMDRTAGDPNYVLRKPFPIYTSNCIVPVTMAFDVACDGYIVHNYDSLNVPNNGEGIYKDLSGNRLPNAPKFTATITADYTLPLPHEWLVTLHTDVYYQSEAWTRVFNDDGYDKLKAYNNINVAAIFSNEAAGWQVMAYVKNVLDRDNITGAFLNSDDTGLTTNVFLNEPRLYGVRVTKQFDGSGPVGSWFSDHEAGRPYPFRLELGGAYGHFSGGHELVVPDGVAWSPAAHPYPLGIQNELDWGGSGDVKLTYRPGTGPWLLAASVRYGRAAGSAEAHPKWEVEGGYLTHLLHQTPDGTKIFYDPTTFGWYAYATATASNEESHAIVDFMVGRDVGLGDWLADNSNLSVGVQYAQFKSSSNSLMHGRPDLGGFPSDDVIKYGGHTHRFHSDTRASREFEGAGPAAAWNGVVKLVGSVEDWGRIDLDIGLGGGVLWGKQSARMTGDVRGEYALGIARGAGFGGRETVDQYDTPINRSRSRRVTVPSANASLGLTYELGRAKVSGGYRWERYFDAIDGGVETHKSYDRQFDGPYFKVSVGFGG